MQQHVNGNSRAITKHRETRPYWGLGVLQPLYNSVTEYAPDSKFSGWSPHLDPDQAIALYNKRKAGAASTGSVGTALGHEALTERRFSRGGMNNVVHTKLGLINLPFGMMWTPAWGGVYIADYNRVFTTRGYNLQLAQPTFSYSDKYSPGTDSLFSSRAYWSMRPKFHGDVSIINSIFELKDFRDVFKPAEVLRNLISIKDNARRLRRVAGYGTEHLAKVWIGKDGTSDAWNFKGYNADDALRDSTGVAASLTLAYNLLIKPTIADVMAIMAQCATAAAEAEKAFAASGDDGSLSHYSEEFIPIQNGSRGSRAYDCYFTGQFTHVKRTATMRSFYSYKLRPLNEALVKYWGLTGTTEALWNMLPFSFVLDYVLTVGRALKYMASDNRVTNLTYEYCESTRVTSGDGIAIYHDPRIRSLVLDGVYIRPRTNVELLLVSGTHCTRYARRVMDPYVGPALPVLRKPTSSQWANLIALARLFV